MSLRDLLARLARLEALLTIRPDAGPFVGSARFWAALHRPWPHPGLTDAERAELRRVFFPAPAGPDTVEAEVAAMESLARTPGSHPGR